MTEWPPRVARSARWRWTPGGALVRTRSDGSASRRPANRPAFEAGVAARAAGRPIWSNPRVGHPARAWARGWKTTIALHKGER